MNVIITSLAEGLLIIRDGVKLWQNVAWWLDASFPQQHTTYIFIFFFRPLFSFYHLWFGSLATFTYLIMQNHKFSVLLTVHPGMILVNIQLDAQFFLVCLFLFSTCFGQPCAHHQDNYFINATPGVALIYKDHKFSVACYWNMYKIDNWRRQELFWWHLQYYMKSQSSVEYHARMYFRKEAIVT